MAARLIGITLLALSASLQTAQAADPGGVRVVDQRSDFVVDASNGRELERQLGALRTDKGSHGQTAHRIETRFVVERQPAGCRVDDIDVTVRLTTSLPRWEPPRRQPRRLQQSWDEAIAGLARHEAGHRDHAIAAAEAIRSDLVALPVEADCDVLRMRAQRIVNRHLFRADMRDLVYDHRTRSGATQGAVLVLDRFVLPRHDELVATGPRDRQYMPNRPGAEQPIWRRGPYQRPNPRPDNS